MFKVRVINYYQDGSTTMKDVKSLSRHTAINVYNSSVDMHRSIYDAQKLLANFGKELLYKGFTVTLVDKDGKILSDEEVGDIYNDL